MENSSAASGSGSGTSGGVGRSGRRVAGGGGLAVPTTTTTTQLHVPPSSADIGPVSQDEYDGAPREPRRRTRKLLIPLCHCRRSLAESVRPVAEPPSSQSQSEVPRKDNIHLPSSAVQTTGVRDHQRTYMSYGQSSMATTAKPTATVSPQITAPSDIVTQAPRYRTTQTPPPRIISDHMSQFLHQHRQDYVPEPSELGRRQTHTAGNGLLPVRPADDKRPTLVLDLDETLVHSEFRRPQHCDFRIEVEIDGNISEIFVSKRPGVDEFLNRIAPIFEVVIFTASLDKYANKVIDELDPNGVCSSRLFRDHCTHMPTDDSSFSYVKDLSRLGRDLRKVIIVDNSQHAFILQPDNGIPIGSWFGNQNDRELDALAPILEDLAAMDNVPLCLRQAVAQEPFHNSNIANNGRVVRRY